MIEKFVESYMFIEGKKMIVIGERKKEFIIIATTQIKREKFSRVIIHHCPYSNINMRIEANYYVHTDVKYFDREKILKDSKVIQSVLFVCFFCFEKEKKRH